MLTEQVQFADIQPVAVAVRAGIYFDLMATAVKVAPEENAFATGAGAFAPVINMNKRVDGDVQKCEALGDVWRLEFLEFEGVEPDAAAAAGADIHGKIGNADGFEAVGADGASHTLGQFNENAGNEKLRKWQAVNAAKG